MKTYQNTFANIAASTKKRTHDGDGDVDPKVENDVGLKIEDCDGGNGLTKRQRQNPFMAAIQEINISRSDPSTMVVNTEGP